MDSATNYLIDNGAIQRNFEIWDKKFALALYKAKIARLKDFIEKRAACMDDKIT